MKLLSPVSFLTCLFYFKKSKMKKSCKSMVKKWPKCKNLIPPSLYFLFISHLLWFCQTLAECVKLSAAVFDHGTFSCYTKYTHSLTHKQPASQAQNSFSPVSDDPDLLCYQLKSLETRHDPLLWESAFETYRFLQNWKHKNKLINLAK